MKTALIFSGQGSQYVGMNEIFINNYNEIAQKFFDLSNQILKYNIQDLISNGPVEKLNNTKYTQPSIFIISAIAYEIFKNKGINADFCAGHSVGEITALYAAGALSFKEALLFIQERADYMEMASKKNPGKMLALIKPSDKSVKSIIQKDQSICVANINSSNQIILSGSVDSINEIIPFCKKEKIKCILLPVSGAFHSDLMKSASDSLLNTLNQLNLVDSMMPIYQNINALPQSSNEMLRRNLKNQIISTVKWKQTIENMIKDKAVKFIEIGPKKILTNLLKKSHPNIECYSIEELILSE